MWLASDETEELTYLRFCTHAIPSSSRLKGFAVMFEDGVAAVINPVHFDNRHCPATGVVSGELAERSFGFSHPRQDAAFQNIFRAPWNIETVPCSDN
jgi:hypothetical protein